MLVLIHQNQWTLFLLFPANFIKELEFIGVPTYSRFFGHAIS